MTDRPASEPNPNFPFPEPPWPEPAWWIPESGGFYFDCLVPGCGWRHEEPVQPRETWKQRSNAILDAHKATHG